MNHKEMTAHIRNRLKAQNVPARVKMLDACGVRYVTIVTPTYEFRWNAEQAKAIAICVSVNKLTCARGMAIDIDHVAQVLQNTTQYDFEFHG